MDSHQNIFRDFPKDSYLMCTKIECFLGFLWENCKISDNYSFRYAVLIFFREVIVIIAEISPSNPVGEDWFFSAVLMDEVGFAFFTETLNETSAYRTSSESNGLHLRTSLSSSKNLTEFSALFKDSLDKYFIEQVKCNVLICASNYRNTFFQTCPQINLAMSLNI